MGTNIELRVRELDSDGNFLSFQPVQIHPSSLLAREKIFGTPFLIFHELARTTRLYLRQVTPVPPLAIALFAGALSCNVRPKVVQQHFGRESTLLIGNYIRLRVPATTCNRILEIRKRLDMVWKVTLQGQRLKDSSEDA